MFVSRTARAGLGLVVMLLLQTAAQAQEQGKERAKATDTPAKAKKDEKKVSPELAKARAEVKKLEDQMKSLHEQMRDTAEKLHKAYREEVKLGGFAEARGRRHHGGWASFGWRGHGMGGMHAWHRPGAVGFLDLEHQVERLQREVDQLRHAVHEEKK